MDQAEHEREIFKEFAEVAPFTVLPGTIQSRNPPEPDILCQIEHHGEVGFELTELIDQDYMARLGLMFKTKQYLNNYWQKELDTSGSDLFRNKYSDALLHFEYSQETALKERKDTAKKVFQKLLKLPNDSEGQFMKSDPELSPIIKWVQISRIGSVEPIIDVSSYGWLGDPTAIAISKKFKKNYMCDYPIELLAHINWGIMPHKEVWKDSAKRTASNISGSPFRKLWVFDNTDKSIKYSYEE